MNMQQQQGIGLVEVMVALLLLAIAVLGFSALQMSAVGATDESLVRTRATSVVRTLSETMRNNIDHLAEMQKVLNGETTSVSTCNETTPCNAKQMAEYSAKEIKDLASSEGFTDVSLQVCPGTNPVAGQKIYCAIVAWGDTTATLGSGSNDCADSSGIYHAGATCLIMETY